MGGGVSGAAHLGEFGEHVVSCLKVPALRKQVRDRSPEAALPSGTSREFGDSQVQELAARTPRTCVET